MKSRTWREKAAHVIDRAASRWRAARGLGKAGMFHLPEAERAELMRAVRAAYPFGERTGYPYKAWLEEVRLFETCVQAGYFRPAVFVDDPEEEA